jgi:glycosyltransferase involved in cell wall biosynthesis
MVDTLSDTFQRRGIEPLFVGDRYYAMPSWLNGTPVSDGSTYGAMFRDALRPSMYRTAVDALVAAQPDACYFVSVHPANGPLAWAIRRRVRNASGRPPVIAMHIHDPMPHPGLASLAIFTTQQMQLRAADRVFVYGAALARQVHRLYRIPNRRLFTIPHGVYRPPREVPPANTPPQWFSFLGRIERYKGLEVFLKAAEMVSADFPACRFFVGGAGDLEPYQEAIQRLGNRVVVQHRELSNEETDDIMQASWAVVLPYNSATQSGVIPVAYWNGSPVIVTDTGALAEMVREEETGFIVQPGDTAAVADRMRRLLRDPALRGRLGAGAFSFYDRSLRWERIANDLVAAMGLRSPSYAAA